MCGCDACLVAWCARNGWRPASLVSHMSRRVDACKRRERAWNPRGFDEVRRKVQRLQAVAAADELCTCSDGVPSILCRVNVCFATAAGATCEERVVPGMSCSCICWEDAEVVSIKDYHQNIKDFWIKDHRIFPGPPTPAGGWPPSDEAANRAASRARYKQGGACVWQLTTAPHAPAASSWHGSSLPRCNHVSSSRGHSCGPYWPVVGRHMACPERVSTPS